MASQASSSAPMMSARSTRDGWWAYIGTGIGTAYRLHKWYIFVLYIEAGILDSVALCSAEIGTKELLKQVFYIKSIIHSSGYFSNLANLRGADKGDGQTSYGSHWSYSRVLQCSLYSRQMYFFVWPRIGLRCDFPMRQTAIGTRLETSGQGTRDDVKFVYGYSLTRRANLDFIWYMRKDTQKPRN